MTYRNQAARGQGTADHHLAALALTRDDIVRPELCNDAILAANSAQPAPRRHAVASAAQRVGR